MCSQQVVVRSRLALAAVHAAVLRVLDCAPAYELSQPGHSGPADWASPGSLKACRMSHAVCLLTSLTPSRSQMDNEGSV